MPEKYESISVEEFQTQFTQLHTRLKSYLFRLTTNMQDAEDLAQDTYIKALKSLQGFAGRATLKTWLFSIATNLARDHHRVRQRWQEDIQDRCREKTQADARKVARMQRIVQESPAEKYDFKEHIDYCFTCIAKSLEIQQQLAIILKEIYGFKVAEIMEILGQSEGQVKYALKQARSTLSKIYERRCELVNKSGVCYQCSEINDFIHPAQHSQQQKSRLALSREAANDATPEKLFDLRALLIRGVDPLNAPGAELHAYLLSLMPESLAGKSEDDRSAEKSA